MPRIRVLVGLIIVAVASVLAAANSLQLSSQLQPDPWSIEIAVERFSGATTRLPAHSAVGYISDLPVTDTAGTLAFLSAQYALAPRFLDPLMRTSPEQAVGNFSVPTDYRAAGAKAGYTLESDLGNGVVLYRKVK
jgi:hypothetical protein